MILHNQCVRYNSLPLEGGVMNQPEIIMEAMRAASSASYIFDLMVNPQELVNRGGVEFLNWANEQVREWQR